MDALQSLRRLEGRRRLMRFRPAFAAPRMPRRQGGRAAPREGFARGFAYLCLVTAVVASACAMVAAACVMLTAVFEVRQASATGGACGPEESSVLQRTAIGPAFAFLRPRQGG